MRCSKVTRVEGRERRRGGEGVPGEVEKGIRERTWEKEAYLKGAEQRVREFFRRKRREQEEKGEESCVKLVVFIFVSFTGAEGRWGVLNFC